MFGYKYGPSRENMHILLEYCAKAMHVKYAEYWRISTKNDFSFPIGLHYFGELLLKIWQNFVG